MGLPESKNGLKNMTDSGTRAGRLWIPNPQRRPHIFINQGSNGSADLNSARHGQFQEKEKNADH